MHIRGALFKLRQEAVCAHLAAERQLFEPQHRELPQQRLQATHLQICAHRILRKVQLAQAAERSARHTRSFTLFWVVTKE